MKALIILLIIGPSSFCNLSDKNTFLYAEGRHLRRQRIDIDLMVKHEEQDFLKPDSKNSFLTDENWENLFVTSKDMSMSMTLAPAKPTQETFSPTTLSPTTSSPSSSPPTLMPTNSLTTVVPSTSPTTSNSTLKCGPNRLEEVFDKLIEAGFSLDSEGDLRAINWILDGDPKAVCADDPNLVRRAGFASLYFATNGDNWTECSQNSAVCDLTTILPIPCSGGPKNWLSDSDECCWGGIGCKSDAIYVILDDNNLIGKVPIGITKVPDLRILQLENNFLSGTIPETFIHGLFRLKLANNDLEDTIPTSLPQSLIALEIPGNKLYGPIPPEFFNSYPELRRLDLSDNSLNGEISPLMSGMSQITLIYLQGNDFTGAIPNTLCDQDTRPKDLVVIRADCQGPFPELSCPQGCCSKCYA